jgi:hypothetical protein
MEAVRPAGDGFNGEREMGNATDRSGLRVV